MPYLATPRKGWENENLANYILSRFSFIARPSSISDDLGQDFFCTLFQKSGKHLVPKNAFWIQIKSNASSYDVSPKLEYLDKLELPTFIGVADQSELKLTIYSGEYLPLFFPYKGAPSNLTLKPCNDYPTAQNDYFTENKEGKFTVFFPKILEISAKASEESIQTAVNKLMEICSRVQKNIATKNMEEHLYFLQNSDVVIYAGRGSAKVFRKNFYYRLAELFFNLEWLLKNNPTEDILREIKFYQDFFRQLKQSNNDLPNILQEVYNRLQENTDKNKTATGT